MKHIDYKYTIGMNEAAIDRHLRETNSGVLALASDNETYAIPVSYYYDGDSILLRLGDHAGSDKMAFIESTSEATFVVYERRDTGDAWSIVIKGPLRRLSDDEMERFDETTINEEFPSLWVFDEDIADMTPAVFELPLEDVTGRETE